MPATSLERSECRSIDELKRFRVTRLRGILLDVAAHVPCYRQLFAETRFPLSPAVEVQISAGCRARLGRRAVDLRVEPVDEVDRKPPAHASSQGPAVSLNLLTNRFK